MNEFQDGRNLPVVTRDTYDTFMRNSVEKGRKDYAEQAAEIFESEQPVLSEDARQFIDKAARSKSEHARMTALALRMYNLLAMQAEAEGLNRLLQD